MSSSMNHFAALSMAQDPSQVTGNASNAAKNRRKKERRKQSHAEADEAVEPMQPAHGRTDSSASQRGTAVLQEASNANYWQVWDSWIRDVRSRALCSALLSTYMRSTSCSSSRTPRLRAVTVNFVRWGGPVAWRMNGQQHSRTLLGCRLTHRTAADWTQTSKFGLGERGGQGWRERCRWNKRVSPGQFPTSVQANLDAWPAPAHCAKA